MAKFIFDGPNKRITLDPSMVIGGIATFSIEELWTEWVDWFLTDDNSKYLPAFRTIGGDPIGGGQYVGKYLFMRNDLGWRGLPPADVDCTIRIQGSFFGQDPDLPVMEPIAGRTTVLVINHSALVFGVDTSGTPAPTAAQNAAAVRDALAVELARIDAPISGVPDVSETAAAVLQAAEMSPVRADVRKIRGQDVVGSGTEADPWGPA